MPRPTAPERLRSRIVAIVAAIPEGRVTTYGAIARRLKVSPREVARVLASFTPAESQELPWFRVVAAGGAVSSLKRGAVGRLQVARLRTEATAVTPRNRVADFHERLWLPP